MGVVLACRDDAGAVAQHLLYSVGKARKNDPKMGGVGGGVGGVRGCWVVWLVFGGGGGCGKTNQGKERVGRTGAAERNIFGKEITQPCGKGNRGEAELQRGKNAMIAVRQDRPKMEGS